MPSNCFSPRHTSTQQPLSRYKPAFCGQTAPLECFRRNCGTLVSCRTFPRESTRLPFEATCCICNATNYQFTLHKPQSSVGRKPRLGGNLSGAIYREQSIGGEGGTHA